MTQANSLSVIIPMFNEAHRFDACLRPILSFLAARHPGCQVILVDDGSRDQTSALNRGTAYQFPEISMLSLDLPTNRGKGAAVREGMLRATGDVRIFADADNATPIEELERLLPMVKDAQTIVIGTRASQTSTLEQPQPWWRVRMGKTFNLVLRMILPLPFRDTQCGFKLFGKGAAEICFGKQTIDRFAFDVELLWIAKLNNLPVLEAPIRWRHVEQSSVRPVRDSLHMALDALRIRWRHRRRN